MNTILNKNFILILFISAISSIGTIGELRAEIIAGENNCDWSGGPFPPTTGVNCQWSLSNEGILIIERVNKNQSAQTGSYGYGSPWSNYYDQIKAIVLDGVAVNTPVGLGAGQNGVTILTINGGSVNTSNLLNFSNPIFTTCEGSSLNNCLIEKGLSKNCSGGKFLQEGKCVSSCGASFHLNDGECDRVRYTPAEAAQYLKDTDNEIIMTFKVNR